MFLKNILLFLFLLGLITIESKSQLTTITNTTGNELATITKAPNIAKPGCQSQCANVTIPYPFGIGTGCFHSSWFEVQCETSFNPPKTFIGTTKSLQILEFSDYTFRIPSRVASQCYDQFGNLIEDVPVNTSLAWASPFSFSQKNIFTLVGCDDFALFEGPIQTNYTSGCIELCSKAEEVVNGSCSGVGCCQTSIPKAMKYYYTSVGSFLYNHTKIWSFDPCTYSFLAEKDRFTFGGVSDFMDPNFKNRTKATVTILVDWVIGNLSCSEARTAGVLACQTNSQCVDSDTGLPGYRCICNKGYKGQPYLDPGCEEHSGEKNEKGKQEHDFI